MAAQLHFAEDAFALHLLFQGFERLIDVVVADENLQGIGPVLRRLNHGGFDKGLSKAIAPPLIETAR